MAKQKRTRKIFVIITIIILAIALILISSVLFKKSQDNKKFPTSALAQSNESSIMAENILRAINSGNYNYFIRDLTDGLKNNINETIFLEFRTNILKDNGKYINKTGSGELESKDRKIALFNCNFDKRKLYFELTINNESKIDYLIFEKQ